MSDDEECKCPEPPPGVPAWVPTFADLMSLLMCFFVLLLSFSEMDAMKFKRLAGSMAVAFGVQNKFRAEDPPKGTSIIAKEFSPGKPEPTPINEIFQRTDDHTEMSLEVECQEEFDVEQGQEDLEAGIQQKIQEKIEEIIEQTETDAIELAKALEEQIATGQVEVETKGQRITIRIREKGSFGSGSATLHKDFIKVLHQVRDVLATKSGMIAVHGHTDNIPINTARFRSNWDLSAARAASVAHELLKDGVLDANRFSISGFSDTKPLVANDNRDNRATNRRVEIKIEKGLDDETKSDIKLLQDKVPDVVKELEPEYQFELSEDEIF